MEAGLKETGRVRPVFLVLLLLPIWLAGYVLNWLGVPVPWLLGPMALALIARFSLDRQLVLPSFLYITAQTVMGLNIGLGSDIKAFAVLGGSAWALVVVVLVPIALSMLGGFILARWAGVDPVSGFLGSIPGAASGVVAMSTDLGADARVVATFQYLRMLSIAAVMPLVAANLPGAAAGSASATTAASALTASPPIPPAHYLLLLVAVPAAFLLARLVRMPAPAFLGPFFLGLGLRSAGLVTGMLPALLSALALGVIGFMVGSGFDRRTLAHLRRAALIDLGVVVMLLLASLGTGWLFHRISGVDLTTAVLGSVPGAMEAVTAAAFNLGADGGVVAAMHLVRFLIAALAGPWLATHLVRRVRSDSAGAADTQAGSAV